MERGNSNNPASRDAPSIDGSDGKKHGAWSMESASGFFGGRASLLPEKKVCELNLSTVSGGLLHSPSSKHTPPPTTDYSSPITDHRTTYDAEGNLTFAGQFNYAWNGESRLARVTSARHNSFSEKRGQEYIRQTN